MHLVLCISNSFAGNAGIAANCWPLMLSGAARGIVCRRVMQQQQQPHQASCYWDLHPGSFVEICLWVHCVKYKEHEGI